MEADIDLMKGARVVGFSFPNPKHFQLKCMSAGLLREHSIAMLDLLFSGIGDVRIINAGPLVASEVTALSREDGDPVRFRFDLSHGFISLTCKQLHIRTIAA
jgi:hypothetical protein